MEEFLIKDYKNVDIDNGEEPKIKIVSEKELWKIFGNAKERFPEIAIYKIKIGECILDWS